MGRSEPGLTAVPEPLLLSVSPRMTVSELKRTELNGAPQMHMSSARRRIEAREFSLDETS